MRRSLKGLNWGFGRQEDVTQRDEGAEQCYTGKGEEKKTQTLKIRLEKNYELRRPERRIKTLKNEMSLDFNKFYRRLYG